jgi:hypothetical protein
MSQTLCLDYYMSWRMPVCGLPNRSQLQATSGIANSYTLQFTTVRIKSSQSVVSLVVAWWRNPTMCSASVFMSLLAGHCPKTNSLPQLSCLLTSPHGTPRKHRSCVAVSNCSRYWVTAVVFFPYVEVVANQRLHMSQYVNRFLKVYSTCKFMTNFLLPNLA